MDTPDSTTPTKRCRKCGETKSRDQFTRSKYTKDGVATQCKGCRASLRAKYKEREQARHKEYLVENREAVLAQKRRNREATQEARMKYAKQYYSDNRDKQIERVRRWRAENREDILARRRQQYADNHEKQINRKRKWRADNREREREQCRQRRAENPDIARAAKHRRRAREQQSGGTCTAADLAAIRAAQTDKQGRLICWRCGFPIKGTPHLDHWIPIGKGGPSDPGNLHYMHETCNKSKGAKHPSELGRLL